MEEISIISCVEDFRAICGHTDRKFYTLQEVIEFSMNDEKPILLYLHNKSQPFSTKILPVLKEKIFEEKFHLVLWDVSDETQNVILMELASNNIESDTVNNFIKNKIAGICILKLDFHKFALQNIAFYTYPINEDDFLRDIQSFVMDSQEKQEGQKLLLTEIQEKYASTFKYEDSISKAVNHALEKQMPLLLYIDAGDIFSEKFNDILNNKDACEIFYNFSMYKIDLSKGCNQSELSSLGNKDDSLQLYLFLKRKHSGLFIYSTTNATIELYKCFHGPIEDEANFIFEVYNSYMRIIDDNENHNESIEKLAIVSFVNYFEEIYGLAHVTFQVDSLEAILKKCMYVDSNSVGKVLVLYLHNSYHDFSIHLMHKLANGPVRERLENFCFLPWYLNDSYQEVLKRTVRDHFDLDLLEKMIENNKPGLFFFVYEDNKIRLYTHAGPGFNLDMLPDVIDNVEEYFSSINNCTDYAELSCSREIENPILNPFRNYITLRQIIPENCFIKQLTARRILLLYFYIKDSKFTDNFLQWLSNSQNASFIKKHFYLVTWDISRKELHQSLLLAIDRYFNLEDMKTLLIRQKSSLFVFQPIAQTLNLVCFVSDNKSLNCLINIRDSFAEEILIETKLPNNPDCAGPVPFQQMMYDRLGNRDYDCIELNRENHETILQQKIGFAFFGPPTDETKAYNDIQNDKIASTANLIKSLCSEINLNNEIMLSCIYTCTTPLPKEKLEKYKQDKNYNHLLDFNIYPVFVLRKCVDSPNFGCRIFIDHELRVYQSWSDYVENNQLPKCICIYPRDGRYTGDIWGNVWVHFKLSPACGIDKAILKGLDIGSAVVGIGAGTIAAASAIPAFAALTVAAPVAAVVGFSVGGYSIIRSGVALYNRSKYKQSLNVMNNEARGAYLNILAGSLGFVGASSTFALSYFAKNGAQIGTIARGTVNGITGMNVLVSGASLVNSSYDVVNQWINDNESPNALVILQLSSSILFFGHSVYNIRSANTIINQAQYEGMQEVMSSLRSNRHRKTVMNLMKESIRQNGSQKGTAEVISYVKNLENRDDVIATLTRSSKLFKQNNVKYSISNGKLNFNGIVVDINDFGIMPKQVQNNSLMNLPENPTNFKLATPKLVDSYINLDFNIIAKTTFTLIQSKNLKDAISRIINIFSNYVQQKLLKILSVCLQSLQNDINICTSLQDLFPPAKQITKILEWIVQFFKSTEYFDEKYYCIPPENNSNSTEEDLETLRKYTNCSVYAIEKFIIFSSLNISTVVREIIKYISKQLIILMYEKMNLQKEEKTRSSYRQQSAKTKTKVCCDLCKGYYYN